MPQHIFWLNPTSVEGSKTSINELRSSATGSQFRLECVCTPPAVARARSWWADISDKERLSHSLPCETAPRRSSSNSAADASSTYGIRHTATTEQQSSHNIAPCDKHSMNDTCYFIFVWIIPHKQSTKHRYRDAVFLLHPTSVEGSKTFINELRSSATGSQALPDRVCTPPAVARARSSSFRISYKARLSHSLPCETAPRRSSSNLAADASSTYGIRHTATTKPPSSYNIAPCDKHSNSVTKTNHVTTHFWLNPTSVEGSKTSINELRSSATGSQFRLECVCTPPAVARARSWWADISDKERLSHSLPCETAPRRSSSNSAADASSTYGIRHTATTEQQSSHNIAPCDKHSMNDTCYFIFVWIIPHKQSTKHRYRDAVFLLHPTSVEGSKTFINELRSSATGSQALPDRVCTPPAVARARSSSFRISYKARLSHSLPCETAPRRSSSNLAADASSTYSIRHTATTKPPSSYNIAPCDKHATFVTILFCPTGPALEVPRHPAIERAALQPQATCCPVHGQHSEHVPFCEAPLQNFLPGHPGAIHDPWSQHCYAAPATEVPRHRTTRMTRSHAPFAQTFPSANETATTKSPQTSRVRDFNQTFCIQKFRDMHICSLAFKTMPWHAWFQNKIERYNIERYNDSRSIFFPLLMHFNENITYIFFGAIHHIDPLHRKQTLTLSQCNSRDLTDSPYRNLEKCKKC